MVWILIVSNMITVAACFMFLGPLARLTQVKGSYIIPPIIVLIVLGGFTTTNQFPDIWVTIGFGVLGWIMVELDWPRPPLVLGLVLGRLAENYLFLSMSAYDLAWLTRPTVLVGIAVIIAAVLYPVFSGRLPAAIRRLGAPDAS
jgi:TctA family transporter